MYGTTKSPQESVEKAIELAQKAIALDDGYPGGHAILGMLYCYKKDYNKALVEGERAVALNPSGADVHAFYGLILTYACRPEEAIPMFQKAIRFNPFGPGWYHINFSFALQNMGRLEEAAAAYKKALQLSPDSIFAHVGLAATYSMMGREKEARAEAEEVLRINPKFSVDSHAKVLPYKDQSVNDRIVAALRKAGLK